jgi:hypothetical protein
MLTMTMLGCWANDGSFRKMAKAQSAQPSAASQNRLKDWTDIDSVARTSLFDIRQSVVA